MMKLQHFVLGAVALTTVLALSGCGSKEAAKSAAQPALQPAAAAAPQFKDLVVSYDIVRGHHNIPADQSADKTCVLNSRFLHNEGIIWRVRVMDPVTGQFMDDKAIEKVEVKLADGQVLKVDYGGHPAKAPTDTYWTTAFEIPEEYPSGALNFTVNVQAKDGRTNSKGMNFVAALSQVTILDGKMPKLAAGK
jgi:hypothetical protein